MARIRSMKPEWTTSRDMRRLSAGGVTIFWILVTQADDEGRLHADAEDIAQMARAWVGPEEVAEQLDRMTKQRMIGRYRVEGEPYIALVNWSLHQRVDHPRASSLPAPPARMMDTPVKRMIRELVASDSRAIREASRDSAHAPADRTRPEGRDKTGIETSPRTPPSVETATDVANRMRQRAREGTQG